MKLADVTGDGGDELSPSSLAGKGEKTSHRLALLPREVFQHNCDVGSHQWSIYRDRLYDNALLKVVFKPLIIFAREERKARKDKRTAKWEEEKLQRKKQRNTECRRLVLKQNGFSKSEDLINGKFRVYNNIDDEDDSDRDDRISDSSDSDEMPSNPEDRIPIHDLEADKNWDLNAVQFIAKNGVDRTTISSHLPQCCIGVMATPTSAIYWRDVMADVKVVLEDFMRADLSGTLDRRVVDYMQLLQRWVKTYRLHDPVWPRSGHGDPNLRPFPLSETAVEPHCLRDYMYLDSWKPLDTGVAWIGAWDRAEEVCFEQFNTHEVFLASLRSHVDTRPFDMEIEGEAGWEVIEEDVIANDETTENQRRIWESRSRRTDLHDRRRMQRRRKQLLDYFVQKYRMDRSKTDHFLRWADAMENGRERFLRLCICNKF